ncbi:MAG: hypothetical protein EPN26_06625 [Rhodospirillales bacterium]|nr:MAG: hypothetical protein EPN26_06625 [Rhodospirillales bacterium]
MTAISSAIIMDTILSGARSAFETYQDLSGGHWVGNAPESFLQACIALAFKDLKDQDDRLYVTLEASTKRILADVDMKIDRRTVKMSDRERFDMLLWYKGGQPRAIIETKKAWNADSCNRDAERIRQWIRAKSNPINSGYVVGYTVAKGKTAVDTIKSRFEAIKNRTGASHYQAVQPSVQDPGGWVWDIACFEIR